MASPRRSPVSPSRRPDDQSTPGLFKKNPTDSAPILSYPDIMSESNSNWRSAQCVSSFYDAYEDLSKERDYLLKENQRMETERDTLRLRFRNLQDQYEHADDICCVTSHRGYDAQLLHWKNEKEKIQYDLSQAKSQHAASEEKLAEVSGRYEKQLLLIREKWNMDPHGGQRVAISCQSLQSSLDQTHADLTELSLQYEALQKEHAALYQAKLVSDLALTDIRFEVQDGHQTRGRKILRQLLRRSFQASYASAFSRWKHWSWSTQHQTKVKKYQEHQHQQLSGITDHKMNFLRSRFLRSHFHRHFHSWVAFVQDIHHRKKSVIQSLLETTKRQQAQALTLWHTRVCKEKKQEDHMQQIFTKMAQFKLKTGWNQWTRVCQQSQVEERDVEILHLKQDQAHQQEQLKAYEQQIAQLNALLVGERQHIQEFATQHELERISARENETKMRNKIIQKCQRLFRHQHLEGRFQDWKTLYQTNKRMRRLGHQLLTRTRQHQLLDSVQRWYEHHQEQVRFKRLTKRFLRAFLLRQVSRCFYSWSEYRESKKNHKAILARFKAHWTASARLKVFQNWQHLVLRRKTCRETWTTLDKSIERHVVRGQWNVWRLIIVQDQFDLEQLERAKACLGRLRSRSVLFVFTQWKVWTGRTLDVRHALRRCLELEEKQHLTQALGHLKVVVQIERAQELEVVRTRLKEVTEKYDALMVEYGAQMNGWSAQNETLRQRIITRMQRQFQAQSLDFVFHRWLRHVQCSIREKRIVTQFLAHLMSRSLHVCFYNWKSHMQHKRRHRQVCRRAQNVREKNIVDVLFGTWKHWHEECHTQRQKVRKTMQRFQNATLVRCFESWSGDVAHTKAVLTLKLIRPLTRYSLRQAWGSWFHLLHAHKSMLVETQYWFEEWNQHVVLQQRYRHVVLRLKNQIVHKTFRQWAAFRLEQQGHREKVRQALALFCCRQYALGFQQWKFWTLWKRHNVQAELELERSNQDQAIAALRAQVEKLTSRNDQLKHAFQSSSVEHDYHQLTFLSFKQWKFKTSKAVHEKQLIRKFVWNLKSKYTTLCFANWKAYAAQKRHRAQILEKYGKRLRGMLLMKGFEGWKHQWQTRQKMKKFLAYITQAEARRSFWSWQTFVARRVHSRNVLHIVQRQSQRLMWEQWKRVDQHAKVMEAEAARAAQHDRHVRQRQYFTLKVFRQTCASKYRHWREITRRRVFCRKFLLRQIHRRQFLGWKRWQDFLHQAWRAQVQQHKTAISQLEERVGESAKALASTTQALESKGLEWAQKAMVSALGLDQYKTTRKCFQRWHVFTQKASSDKHRMKQLLFAWTNKTLHSTFVVWKKSWAQKRHQIQQALQAMNSYRMTIVKSNFRRWKNRVSEKRTQMHLLGRNTFYRWKMTLSLTRLEQQKHDDHVELVIKRVVYTLQHSVRQKLRMALHQLKRNTQDQTQHYQPFQSLLQTILHSLDRSMNFEELSIAMANISALQSNVAVGLYFCDQVQQRQQIQDVTMGYPEQEQQLWTKVRREASSVERVSQRGLLGQAVTGASTNNALVIYDNVFNEKLFRAEIDQRLLLMMQPFHHVPAAAPKRLAMCFLPLTVPVKEDPHQVVGIIQMIATNAHATISLEMIQISCVCRLYLQVLLRKLASSQSPKSCPSMTMAQWQKAFKNYKKLSWNYHTILNELLHLREEVQRQAHVQDHGMNKTIRRLREKLFEKQAELEEAKDLLVDQKHSERTREIITSHSRVAPPSSPLPKNQFAPNPYHDILLTAQLESTKNALMRAESDNIFLSRAIQSAMQSQGQLSQQVYTEVNRICTRLSDPSSGPSFPDPVPAASSRKLLSADKRFDTQILKTTPSNDPQDKRTTKSRTEKTHEIRMPSSHTLKSRSNK